MSEPSPLGKTITSPHDTELVWAHLSNVIHVPEGKEPSNFFVCGC